MRWFAAVAGGVGALAVGAASAFGGPILGLALVMLVALASGVVVFGTERAGVGLVFLGFVAAPMNSLKVASSATVGDVVLLLGFMLLLPRLLRGRLRLPLVYVAGATLVLLTGVAASLNAAQPLSSFLTLGYLLVCIVGLPVAFDAWDPPARTVTLLISGFVIGQAISTVGGFVGGSVSGRFYGLTEHPNFFGDAAMVTFALTIYLWGACRSSTRWLVLGASAVGVVGVVLSGSRADLLVVGVLVLLVPVAERWGRALGLVLGLACAAVLFSDRILSTFGSASAIGRLQGEGSASQSDDARTQALQSGWSLFTQRPLTGHGFVDYYYIHNVYLEIAVGIGVIGLIGYLMVVWSFVRRIRYAGPMHLLAYVAVGFSLLGLVNPALYVRGTWTAIALAVLARRPSSEETTVELDEDAGTPARSASPVGTL